LIEIDVYSTFVHSGIGRNAKCGKCPKCRTSLTLNPSPTNPNPKAVQHSGHSVVRHSGPFLFTVYMTKYDVRSKKWEARKELGTFGNLAQLVII